MSQTSKEQALIGRLQDEINQNIQLREMLILAHEQIEDLKKNQKGKK